MRETYEPQKRKGFRKGHAFINRFAGFQETKGTQGYASYILYRTPPPSLQDLAHRQALALAEVKHRVGAWLMPGYGPAAN